MRLAAERRAGKRLGFEVWPARLLSKSGKGDPRYVFRFPRYVRDDEKAVRVAESVLYSISLAHGPVLGEYEVPPVFRIPADLARDRQDLSSDTLIQVEEARTAEERITGLPWMTLTTATYMSRHTVETAWRIAPIIFENEDLYRAVVFLKASQDDFWVAPGQVGEVASNAELAATTGAEQTAMENALQNAFKAVEAVIGDPPTDDRKFFRKLRGIGLDPHEPVGYGTKAPVHSVIRAMSDARDKRAAHGSTPHRRLGAAEVLEYAACAQYLIWTAVETRLGHAIC
jgi:hypothetical protein